MTRLHLTDLEAKLLTVWPVNYPDDPETEKADNATYTDVAELAAAAGFSIATTKGVLGSLAKKLLVWVDPYDCTLSHEGIDAAARLRALEA